MSRESSTEASASFETIDEGMSDDRSRLLSEIAHADDGRPTGKLREATGVPSGSMHYHLTHLEDWGLIEVIGTHDSGRGSPAKVWALTDRGRDYLDRPGAPAATSRARLEERLAELEHDVEALKETYNELAGVVEDLVNEQ